MGPIGALILYSQTFATRSLNLTFIITDATCKILEAYSQIADARATYIRWSIFGHPGNPECELPLSHQVQI